MRTAGADLLSLALIDARNRTLRWTGAIEDALGPDALRTLAPGAPRAELDPPLWTLGRLAWTQEHWIARNVQRRRGAKADPATPRLASILPEADRWFDPSARSRSERWAIAPELPDAQTLRQYLVDVLETTLELLSAEPAPDDASLYFYRLAVLCEDLQGEAFAVLAQTIGFAPAGAPPGRATGVAPRPAILLPATRWHARARRARLRLRQRAAGARRRDARVRDRRAAGQLVAVRRVRRGRRLRRGALVVGRGRAWLQAGLPASAADEGSGRAARRAMSTSCATACCSGASAARCGCPRRSRRCTSAGTRPTPGAAGPAGACPARSSGRQRRSPARRAAFARATCGNGRRARFRPYPRLRARSAGATIPAGLRSRKVLRGASFATPFGVLRRPLPAVRRARPRRPVSPAFAAAPPDGAPTAVALLPALSRRWTRP